MPQDSIQTLLLKARRHQQENRSLEAAKCYFEVTQRQPDCFEAYCQLGAIFNQANQLEEAVACLEQALRLQPAFPRLHLLMGAVFKKQGRFQEAAACCRREIALNPANPDAHYNLGLVLQNLECPEEAQAAYRRALLLRPDHLNALINLGFVCRQRLETEEALRCFEDAVARSPADPDAHWELCTTLLSLGQFERGWKEYEWRWKLKDFTTPPVQYARPRWDGSPLEGRRILVHCEQGFGDVIQFARYATLVARRGGEVIFGCPAPLRSLIETVPGVSRVVTSRGAEAFDLHVPLMSLPALFGTTLPTVPADVPYLTPPASGFELEPHSGLKVGLVWAGEASHRNDRNRSMPVEHFTPLTTVPRVRCFSLQVGSRADDLRRINPDGTIPDLGRQFLDFGDTARALCQLDLVISVDTAVAHLAGALGRPVWTLLPFEAEWRWMLRRPDSPWYPTMRLFRQKMPGDWQGLLSVVRDDLVRLAADPMTSR